MKHTRGPWKFTRSRGHGRAQVSGHNGHQVCLCWQDGEMVGNANLICAAPELLESLEYAYNCLADHIHPSESGMQDIIFVIKKAKGEL